MQKFTTRYGCMLLCGRLPPAIESCIGAIIVRPALVSRYGVAPLARASATVGLGELLSPTDSVTTAKLCVCIGISLWISVTNSLPDCWPRKYSVPVVDWPWFIG